ncbi:MAG TPA: hypothetical protein VFZ08_12875, partial [Terriglobia bacterium]|nr:hypothetical protein [Terriglobia bacterium]
MRRGIRGLLAFAVFLSASFVIPNFVSAQNSNIAAGQQGTPADSSAGIQNSEIDALKQQLHQQQKQIQALQAALDKQEQLLDQIALLDNNSRDDSA